MTYAIYEQYGRILQGGFDTKEDARRWLRDFKAKARVAVEE